MKVFVNASLTGKKEFGENYDKLCQAVKKAGYEIVSCPVTDERLMEMVRGSTKTRSDFFKKIKRWTKQSDAVVFEVSYPSTAIGFEVALALQMGKPVVAFHVKNAPPNIVLETIKDEKLQLVEYDIRDIDREVRDALQYASEQMDTRFNFFISPDIGAYLDWVSKEKKIPRAVYLRKLIEDEMSVEKDFEG